MPECGLRIVRRLSIVRLIHQGEVCVCQQIGWIVPFGSPERNDGEIIAPRENSLRPGSIPVRGCSTHLRVLQATSLEICVKFRVRHPSFTVTAIGEHRCVSGPGSFAEGVRTSKRHFGGTDKIAVLPGRIEEVLKSSGQKLCVSQWAGHRRLEIVSMNCNSIAGRQCRL